MNESLPTLLSSLPEPEAPPAMVASVMARIAREAETMRAPLPSPVRRERPWWVLTTAGATAACAVVAAGWYAAGMAPDFFSARVGWSRAPLTGVDTSMAGVLALALVTYLTGVFAPARRRT